jgi:hypothetical protein
MSAPSPFLLYDLLRGPDYIESRLPAEISRLARFDHDPATSDPFGHRARRAGSPTPDPSREAIQCLDQLRGETLRLSISSASS